MKVCATIQGSRLLDSDLERDLRYVLKIADEEESCFSGCSHARIFVPTHLNKFDGIKPRPGRDAITLHVYDPILRKYLEERCEKFPE